MIRFIIVIFLCLLIFNCCKSLFDHREPSEKKFKLNNKEFNSSENFLNSDGVYFFPKFQSTVSSEYASMSIYTNTLIWFRDSGQVTLVRYEGSSELSEYELENIKEKSFEKSMVFKGYYQIIDSTTVEFEILEGSKQKGYLFLNYEGKKFQDTLMVRLTSYEKLIKENVELDKFFETNREIYKAKPFVFRKF